MKAVTGSADGGRSAAAASSDKVVTWNVIKVQCAKAINTVTDMKFKDPRTPDGPMAAFFADVAEVINGAFDELAEL